MIDLHEFEKNDGRIAKELSKRIYDSRNSAIDNALEAINSYFRNIDEKKEKLKAKISELEEQKSQIDKHISSFSDALAKATIDGDNISFSNIQKNILSMEQQKNTLDAQINLLSAVTIEGDEKLFEYAQEKVKEAQKICNETINDLNSFKSFAQKQMEFWASVRNMSHIVGGRPEGLLVSKLNEMVYHFQNSKKEKV